MQILYEDEDIVVCVKPVGVDSEHELPALLGPQIYTLHRLDQNVGGVMVYAKNKSSAALFSQMIREGGLVKEYVAMIHGTPPAEGDWEDLLFKDSRKNKVFTVKKQRAGVKKARLTYKLIRAGERSAVRVRLYTGRSHQIRVQFSSRGFPLVGDHKYGSKAKETAPMLWSCCLKFPHNGRELCIEKLPDWLPSE